MKTHKRRARRIGDTPVTMPVANGRTKAGGRSKNTIEQKADALQIRILKQELNRMDKKEAQERKREARRMEQQILAVEKIRQRINQRDQIEEARVIKMRAIDPVKRIPLRIDAKTVVYMRPDHDPRTVFNRYANRSQL